LKVDTIAVLRHIIRFYAYPYGSRIS